MNTRINFKTLAFHLLVPIMLLFIILMLVPGYNDHFKSLAKPFPQISGYIFFGLYALMYLLFGVAAYLVDSAGDVSKKTFNYYYISLLLNLLYIPINFGTSNLLVGFFWSFLLLIFVFLTHKEFKKVSKTSGVLFTIYFVFSLFLAYYSFMMYFLNK